MKKKYSNSFIRANEEEIISLAPFPFMNFQDFRSSKWKITVHKYQISVSISVLKGGETKKHSESYELVENLT